MMLENVNDVACADTLASAPSLDPGPVSGHSMTFETLRHADGNPMMAQDGLPLFYVDHGSVKNQLLCWVNKLAHGLQTCTLEKPRLPPLYLNGLIKVIAGTTPGALVPEKSFSHLSMLANMVWAFQ